MAPESKTVIRCGRFTISLPEPKLEIKDGQSIELTTDDMFDLSDLLNLSLAKTKRIFKPHTGGNPTQIDEDVNAQLTT